MELDFEELGYLSDKEFNKIADEFMAKHANCKATTTKLVKNKHFFDKEKEPFQVLQITTDNTGGFDYGYAKLKLESEIPIVGVGTASSFPIKCTKTDDGEAIEVKRIVKFDPKQNLIRKFFEQ